MDKVTSILIGVTGSFAIRHEQRSVTDRMAPASQLQWEIRPSFMSERRPSRQVAEIWTQVPAFRVYAQYWSTEQTCRFT